MKAQRVPADRSDTKYAHLYQFVRVYFPIVKKILPKETIEAGYVDVQSCHDLGTRLQATHVPRRKKRDNSDDITETAVPAGFFVAAGPVSRILSAIAGGTAIPLGPALLLGSSGLPGGLARRAGTRRWRTSGFLPI